jgi:hypothetical protein
MIIIIAQNPSQSFINSENEIMKIVFISTIIGIKLLPNFAYECMISQQIVQ